MIINFSVENFKSIKEKQTLSFEATSSTELEDDYIIVPKKSDGTDSDFRLLKMGIIYGANASGKTTVLEALSTLLEIISHPMNNKENKISIEPFKFSKDSVHTATKFELNFISEGIHFFYEISLNKHHITEENLYFHEPNSALVFSRTTDNKKELTRLPKFGSKIKLSKREIETITQNTLWNEPLLTATTKVNIDCRELDIARKWFSTRLPHNNIASSMFLKGLVISFLDEGLITKNEILVILRDADFSISNFKIEDGDHENTHKFSRDIQRQITINHNLNGEVFTLDFDEESEGTQKYYLLAGLLASTMFGDRRVGSLLIIDELEKSLHPDLIHHFIATFLKKTKNSQLLTTTHFREFLDSRELYRDDIIWFTEKNKHLATELYCLADFDSSTLRKSSSVYNAYKAGRLGAVPKI